MSKEYSTKMRRLLTNLKDKKNPGLRAGVVSGDIPVEKFVVMTAEVSCRGQVWEKTTDLIGCRKWLRKK